MLTLRLYERRSGKSENFAEIQVPPSEKPTTIRVSLVQVVSPVAARLGFQAPREVTILRESVLRKQPDG